MNNKQTIQKMGKRVLLLNKFDELVSDIYNKQIFLKNLFSSNDSLQVNRQLVCKENDICFIIGNGPSLRKEDLLRIQNYPVFTVNLFHKGFPSYNSAFHVCVDPKFTDDAELRNYIINTYNRYINTKFIFHSRMADIFKQQGCKLDRAYFIKAYYVQCKNNIRVDMTKIMTGSINVIPVTIECALYMGFKHIYLLGCDMNLLSNHFYDPTISVPQKERGSGLRASSYAFFHHYALDDYASKTGREIVNLTPGSLLDSYKMDTLENVI